MINREDRGVEAIVESFMFLCQCPVGEIEGN